MKNNYIIPDIYISFETTRQCNMSCVYCYNKNVIHEEADSNDVTMAFFFRKIKKLVIDNPEKIFEFDILGGEPSLTKRTVKLVNDIIDISLIYTNIKIITITTNGVELLKDFDLLKDSKILKFEISYHNEISNIQSLYENMLIYRKRYLVTCTINLYKYLFDYNQIMECLFFCKKHNIETSAIVIYIADKNQYLKRNIIKEIFNYISLKKDVYLNNNPEDAYLNKDFNNVNNNCWLSSFNILFDGTISTSCGHKLIDKNIRTSNIPLFEIIKCNGVICEGSAGLNQRKSYEKFKGKL